MSLPQPTIVSVSDNQFQTINDQMKIMTDAMNKIEAATVKFENSTTSILKEQQRNLDNLEGHFKTAIIIISVAFGLFGAAAVVYMFAKLKAAFQL